MNKSISQVHEHHTLTSSHASRRQFLSYTSLGLIGCSGLFVAPLTYAQITTQVASGASAYVPPMVQLFHRVACVICAKSDLDRSLSAIALEALQPRIPDMGLKLQRLSKLLEDPELLASVISGNYPVSSDEQAVHNGEEASQQYDELRAVVQHILQALYVGAVGEGANARLISYEQALMFIPTRDVTVIPSYSRGGYNYWTTPAAV